jgi:AraC family transcriptional activator FtrA
MLSNRRVVAVAYDGLCAFEFGIASELFGLARPELGVPWYEYRVIAATPGPIRGLGGITVQASSDLRHVRRAGTIVLPGWQDKDIEPPRSLLAALRSAHANGARIMSICSGVYLLAATGLLDGMPATTHWRYADHLATRYPSIDVRPDVLFVDNGQLLTSAGSAAGLDLGLHLIRRDHGAAIAAEVARRLVMPPQREGGQAQFIRHSTSIPETDDRRISEAAAWAQGHLDEEITVAKLASRAHMSTRTFARRFLDQIGTSPVAWVLAQRLQRAQALLETTQLPLADIARTTGYSSVETMRHHFREDLGTSPSRYRATFSDRAATLVRELA